MVTAAVNDNSRNYPKVWPVLEGTGITESGIRLGLQPDAMLKAWHLEPDCLGLNTTFST